MSNALLSVRLSIGDLTVDSQVNLEPVLMARLDGPDCFKRDEALDHLIRYLKSGIDLALIERRKALQ